MTHKSYTEDCLAAFKIFDIATLKGIIQAANAELRIKEDNEKASKVGEILKLAESLGMSGKELAALLNTRKQVKPPPSVKFVHPSNPRLAWTGRGQVPGWIKSWENQHGNRDALMVKEAA